LWPKRTRDNFKEATVDEQQTGEMTSETKKEASQVPVDRQTAIRRIYGNLKGLRDNLKEIKKAAGWVTIPEPPACLIFSFAAVKRIEENLKIILKDGNPK
jgi:hypothetical protein